MGVGSLGSGRACSSNVRFDGWQMTEAEADLGTVVVTVAAIEIDKEEVDEFVEKVLGVRAHTGKVADVVVGEEASEECVDANVDEEDTGFISFALDFSVEEVVLFSTFCSDSDKSDC